MLLFGEASLRRALANDCEHYNVERPHQDQVNVIPFPGSAASQPRDGPIQCRERLGGLLKYYHREAGMSILTIRDGPKGPDGAQMTFSTGS